MEYASSNRTHPVPTSSKLSYSTALVFLAMLMPATIVACWSAGYRYGFDKHIASNFFWLVFIIVFSGILLLPWLNLKGQEHLNRAQRMEKMCVTWVCLTMAPHLLWELPWVLFYHTIMAGKDQLWAYGWWAYMDGGDLRYITRDIYLVAMEVGASTIGILAAITLWRRHKTGAFTVNQLLLIMALMVADFYPTYVYYVTEIFQGFPSVGSTADLLLKFIGANIFWLFMPWVVFIWAGHQLAGHRAHA